MTLFTPVSRGIVQDELGHILLVRHKVGNPWTLPGGHVEHGETFQDALVREVYEEFQLTIELVGKCGQASESHVQPRVLPVDVRTITFTNDRGEQQNYEEYFQARVVGGTLDIQVSEIAEYSWKTIQEIQKTPLGEIYERIREIILACLVT